MKRQFIVGVIGGILGIATAAFVIFTSVSSDMTPSGRGWKKGRPDGGSDCKHRDPVCRVDAALIRGLDPALDPACRNILPDILVPAGHYSSRNSGRALFHGN